MTLRLKPIELLLVEDSPGDVRLTKESLKGATTPHRLHVVCDGVEAMDFLHRRAPFEGSPRPDLVLLDLNMPRKSGREVLAEMKSEPRLQMIPVVVLTTSDAERDISESYRHSANCFITKPVDLDHFDQVINLIHDFWFDVVRLPKPKSLDPDRRCLDALVRKRISPDPMDRRRADPERDWTDGPSADVDSGEDPLA